MTLWAILTIFTAVAAVFFAAPLLRRSEQARESRPASEIDICCGQLAELEKNVAAGRIDGAEAESARSEIKRRLLAGARSGDPTQTWFSLRERNLFAVAVTSAVVLASVALHAWIGDPEPTSSSTQYAGQEPQGLSPVERLAALTTSPDLGLPSANPAQARLGSVDEMVARLLERLKRNPNDPEGWRLLGWSYLNTERFAQAADAYAKAIELSPQNAEFYSSRGEALVRAANGLVTGEARIAFAQALRLDPRDAKGRFFVGLEKEQAGDKHAALEDWIAILNDTSANEPWAADLKVRVTELAKEMGVDVSTRLSAAQLAKGGLLSALQESQTAPASPERKNAGPTADDVRNAAAMSATDRTAMIREMVDRLATRLDRAPRDAEGWIQLMRSRQVLGEAENARQALRFALEVFKDSPQEQERISAAARELGLPR